MLRLLVLRLLVLQPEAASRPDHCREADAAAAACAPGAGCAPAAVCSVLGVSCCDQLRCFLLRSDGWLAASAFRLRPGTGAALGTLGCTAALAARSAWSIGLPAPSRYNMLLI